MVLEKLQHVLRHLKNTFVGKDEIIDLLGICLIAKENAFLLGPPGTAKSAIVREFARSISDGNNFEYLLTRFTEPNEIFGPFDIRKLKEGDLLTNTEGMLPEASMVFLDEIFNANSAILNSLLMALNERLFRRGKESRTLPALMFVGASNLLPEDEGLAALLDRFLIRIPCGYVRPEQLQEVLIAGWKLEKQNTTPPSILRAEILALQKAATQIDLAPIQKDYLNLIYSLRNTGIQVSDRRAVKLQNLIAASALSCGRQTAILADLWIMKYIWDTEEQIEILESMVNTVIGKDEHPQAHPQAVVNKVPNAELLLEEIRQLQSNWNSNELNLQEQNVVKDKLRYLQSRADWIHQSVQKQFIQKEIDQLWESILKEV